MLRSVTEEEACQLERLAHGQSTEARLRARARVCCLSHGGQRVSEIVTAMEMSDWTVRKWIKRFNGQGLAGLKDQARSGRPPTYSRETIAEIVTAAQSDPTALGLPFGHWTLDRLASYVMEEKGNSMKRSRIGEILAAEGVDWCHQEPCFGERPASSCGERKGASTSSPPPKAASRRRRMVQGHGPPPNQSGRRKHPAFNRPAFGRGLREARMLLGLSYGDLQRMTSSAMDAGISRSSVKHAEAARRDLPAWACSRLIQELEAEAQRQSKQWKSEDLWTAAGLIAPLRMSRRVIILRSAAAAAATVGTLREDPASTDGRNDTLSQSDAASFDALMSEAEHLSSRLAYAQATVCYAQAAAAANSREDAAYALARQAYALRRQSKLDTAWEISTEALQWLGALDLAPERGISSAQIQARATNTRWLEAYGMVTRVRGHIADDREQFDTARAAFMTLANLGEALGSDSYRAHATTFVGRLDISQATELAQDYDARWPWRAVKAGFQDQAQQGIRRIQEARQLYPASDGVSHAHSLFQELKATWILTGKSRSAARLEAEALEAFGSSRAVGNLYLARGWLGLAEGDRTETIEGDLAHAFTLAQEIESGLMISETLAAFAELYVGLPVSEHEDAIASCLAALGTWPSSVHARDCRRMRQLYQDLDITDMQLRNALDKPRGRLEQVAQLPEFTDRLRAQLALLGVSF